MFHGENTAVERQVEVSSWGFSTGALNQTPDGEVKLGGARYVRCTGCPSGSPSWFMKTEVG